jgi:hypothetical protein
MSKYQDAKVLPPAKSGKITPAQARKAVKNLLTNPKARAGIKKLTISNVPISILVHCAAPMNHGASKYETHNWIDKDKGLDMMTYIDAALRHLILFKCGEDTASDSGYHHLDHIMAGLGVLRDAMLIDNVVDNRIKYPNIGINRLKEMLEGNTLEEVIKKEK